MRFSRIAYIFYISTLFLIASPAFAGTEPHQLSSSNRFTRFQYIHDKDNRLTPQSASVQFEQGVYKTISGEAFNIGNSDDIFWIRVSVFNDFTEKKTRRLVFGAPFLPVLNAYLLSEKGIVTLLKHDGHQPFGQRVNDKVKLNSIAFELPPLEKTNILIQYRPRGVSFMPISLESDLIFFNQVHLETVRSAIFYSFSLTVILTFFFFGIAMRNRIVLFYALLFLEYIFFLFIIEGYAFKYLWPDWPQWNMRSGLVMALVVSASGFFMSSMVVEKTAIYKQFKFFCHGMAVLSLSMLILIPFSGNVMMMTINYIVMILMLVSQGYCIYSWMALSSKRNSLAFYTALLLVGAAFYVFTLFLDSSALSEWLVVSFNRILYLFVSLTTMGTFAIHLGGLRNDHENALLRELESAQRDAELNKALFESEQRYSQARDLANKRQLQLATASHDIRQPLLSLRSTMDVLSQEQSSAVRKQMTDALNYIEQLCSNYLAETRPGNERRPNSESYPVKMITDSVSKMFQREAFDKGLKFEVMPCSAEISCIPMPLIRILSNYVSNAIKHCDQGNRILIGCRRLQGQLRIDVYDNGPGIAPKVLETILQPYQKDETSEGEGLGLAIVRELADLHSWEISIDSKLGKGSRFSIIIPMGKIAD